MMLGHTMIQVHEDGAMRPAKNLASGDVVFDRLAGRYQELKEVYQKKVEPSQLWIMPPIQIHTNAFGKGWPEENVFVTPCQKVLAPLSHPDKPHRIKLQLVSANWLVKNRMANKCELIGPIEYVAFFFECEIMVYCSGLFFEAHTL